MSRSKKGDPSPGKEYWGKRPLARNHGAIPGKATKKLTHRLERIEGRREIEKELNTNSTVDDRESRFDLGCSFCPPNKHENAKRKGKHGKTKPKYKNKRR